MLETRRLSTRVLLQILLTVLAIPYLIPLLLMIHGSLQGRGWGNYEVVFSLSLLPGFFRNSAIIAGSVIALVMVCTLTAAYAFSKLHIRGKEVYFWTLLACLVLPGVVLISPLFATMIRLHLFNSLWAVIIPIAALQIPFMVLLARNFVDGISDELLEAARVDGANTLRTFWNVLLPMTRPIMAAIVVLAFIASWNDYLFPLLFLQTPEQQTITLVPSYFIGRYNNDQTKVLAAAVVTALPVIIAYIFLQKYFERGLSAGALK